MFYRSGERVPPIVMPNTQNLDRKPGVKSPGLTPRKLSRQAASV
jgi:hypothetical protein